MTTNPLIISLIGGLCMGYVTSIYARQKNLSPRLWFFLGVAFGFFAPLYLFLTSYFKIEKEEKIPVSPSPKIGALQHIDWYYLDQDHHQVGPLSFTAFKEAYQNSYIQEDSYIWNETMDQWEHLKERPEILEALQ